MKNHRRNADCAEDGCGRREHCAQADECISTGKGWAVGIGVGATDVGYEQIGITERLGLVTESTELGRWQVSDTDSEIHRMIMSPTFPAEKRKMDPHSGV